MKQKWQLINSKIKVENHQALTWLKREVLHASVQYNMG